MVLFINSFLAERHILFVSEIAIFIFKRRIFDGTETEEALFFIC